MNKQKKIVIWIVGVPLLAVTHCYIQYLLFDLFVTWGYSESPPSKWTTVPFQIIFFILNPLTPFVGFVDHKIIRLSDYSYYLSAVLSAIIWACLIVLTGIKIANHRLHSIARKLAQREA